MPVKNPKQKPIEASIAYESGGPKIDEWHRKRSATRRLIVGAYSVGKSYLVVFEVLYMLLVGAYQGKRAIFVTRDHNLAIKNVLKKIILKSMLAGFPKNAYKVTWTSPASIEFWNGSEIIFMSHTSEAINGNSCSIAVLDEANRTTSDDLLDSLENVIGREGLPGKLFIAANPTNKSHWLYQNFWKLYDETGSFPEDSYGVSLSLYDSKHVLPSKIKSMEQAYAGRPAMFQRAVLGNFSDNSGQVYSAFEPDVHVLGRDNETQVDTRPVLDSTYKYSCALDFGYHDPTAFLMVAYKNGDYYVFREYEKSGTLFSNHARKIREMLADERLGTKRPPVYADHDAQPRAEYAALGIQTQKAKKERMPGVNAIATLFEENRLYIFDNCKDLIREIESYAWDEKRDAPKDGNDHLLDCLRYSIYSINYAGIGNVFIPSSEAKPNMYRIETGTDINGDPIWYEYPAPIVLAPKPPIIA